MTADLKKDLTAIYKNLSDVLADVQAANKKCNDEIDDLDVDKEEEAIDELNGVGANLDDCESELQNCVSMLEEFAP